MNLMDHVMELTDRMDLLFFMLFVNATYVSLIGVRPDHGQHLGLDGDKITH